MFGNNSKEAELYYLYMMADGEVTHGEEKLFDVICKDELKIDNDEKKSIIRKCKKLADGTTDIFTVLMNERIDEQVGQGCFGDESSLARIIWNLVNLGYADSCYTDEEKKIVAYLVDKWSVSPEVHQELVDIADTILALTKQKAWITSTFDKGQIRDKKVKDVNSKIKGLLDSVKLTIEELSI